MKSRWLDLIRGVGRALLEVFRAELDALAGDLRSSGRRLSGAVVQLAVAAFLLFWAVGVLAYATIELLALWLPRWGAAGVLLALLLLVALVLGWFARRRLRDLESPVRTVRRHLDEHVDWFQDQVLQLEEREGDGEEEL